MERDVDDVTRREGEDEHNDRIKLCRLWGRCVSGIR